MTSRPARLSMDEQGMVDAITLWLKQRYPDRLVKLSKNPTENTVAWDLTKVVGGHYADLVVLGIQDECFTSVWSARDIIEELERQGAVDGLKKTDHRLLVSLSNELILEPWVGP